MTEKNLAQLLKSFFERSPLALEASKSLRDGRQIEIEILPASATAGTKFTFEKVRSNPQLREQNAEKPDVSFKMPETVAHELVSREFKSVGQVGLFLFESITTSDSARKTHISLKCGPLSLVTGGYFGILTSGGGDVAKYLASRGLGNLGKLKDAIARMKSS